MTLQLMTFSPLVSIHSLATPIGSFISAQFMDSYGRRSALLFSVLPLITGWIVIALADIYKSMTMILVGRVICGIAVGLMSAPAQVICENPSQA